MIYLLMEAGSDSKDLEAAVKEATRRHGVFAMTDYLYPHTWERERHRLVTLERLWDQGTIVALERCGIERGCRCLEAGAGSGSIARWLAHRVAPDGFVVATDIDIRNLDPGGHPNVEVRRHDIISDDLPADAFDLVHARLLLKHLPDRKRALANMVGGLRSGGWLVAEDTDWSSAGVDPPEPAFAEALTALRALTEATGAVPDYGRALPEALALAGLTEVGSSRVAHRLRCGTLEVEFFRLTFEQVRDRVVADGLIPARRLDAALEALDAPGGVATSFTMVTAWGRKAGR
jgi:SAM-dependent methyltransferase